MTVSYWRPIQLNLTADRTLGDAQLLRRLGGEALVPGGGFEGPWWGHSVMAAGVASNDRDHGKN